MSNQPLDKELDPAPLVNTLVEKTKAGKLTWEATALDDVFIASVGGTTTLKVHLLQPDWEGREEPGHKWSVVIV